MRKPSVAPANRWRSIWRCWGWTGSSFWYTAAAFLVLLVRPLEKQQGPSLPDFPERRCAAGLLRRHPETGLAFADQAQYSGGPDRKAGVPGVPGRGGFPGRAVFLELRPYKRGSHENGDPGLQPGQRPGSCRLQTRKCCLRTPGGRALPCRMQSRRGNFWKKSNLKISG